MCDAYAAVGSRSGGASAEGEEATKSENGKKAKEREAKKRYTMTEIATTNLINRYLNFLPCVKIIYRNPP